MNNQRTLPWLIALLVAAMVSSTSLLIRQASSAASMRSQSASSAFCDVKVVRNFLAGIERAAPIRQLPSSRHVPFLPKGVSVYAIGSGLEVGSAAIGFAFSDAAINHPRRLDIWTKTTLSEVAATGVVIRQVKTKTQFLGTRRIDSDEP